MKVVVAGGSGFLGRHVAAALLARGHEVVTLDRGRRAAPAGVTSVRADVATGEIPAAALAGADAVVNLVGIKRAAGAQTFEAVHVEAVRRLIAAAQAAGVARLVHVSVVCSRPDDASPYHDTKWRAEALLRESGLAVTILKPAVIYGAGDDMLTHLVQMIRCAPVFPIVGRGDSLLQPVDVRDVARAVAAALGRPETAGRAYDVVGPERLTLRAIVRTVAQGLGLRLAIVPTPLAILRPLVALWSWMSARALSTPAQLRMIEEGLVGDPEPARRDLGLEPRPFSVESVRAVAPSVPAISRDVRGTAAVVAAGIALSFGFVPLLPNAWFRMAAVGASLSALSFALVPLPWRVLLTPSRRSLAVGAAAAALLYVTGGAIFLALSRLGAGPQIDALYAWRDLVPRALVWPLLMFIVLTEELVWRNAVTLPLAERFGPWTGAALGALAFTVAHVAMGAPVLLLAALGAGFFWGLLVVYTRSAVPALISHLVWDTAVLLLWPYPDLLR